MTKTDIIAGIFIVIIVVMFAFIGEHFQEKSQDLEVQVFALQDSVQVLNDYISGNWIVVESDVEQPFNWWWFLVGCSIFIVGGLLGWFFATFEWDIS